ncbi:spore cortex biosynthesis protein YabQ [Gorillibacterium sp. CAU 1737]|uniref:spore cortex biosynthesis protein YabQ n=1 Tax=Gorillibacterium sp. CAU 1737 TaxID=3140362 RepID=UPI0032604359
MTLETQALTLAVMLGCGLGMGVVFDAYRVMSGQVTVLRKLLPLFDLLYWGASTVFVFLALNRSNEGQLRSFVFLGLALGVLLYYLLFSRFTVWLVHKGIAIVRWLIRAIRRLIEWFVVKPLILLLRLVLVILGIAASVSIFLGKGVLKLTYPLQILLLWLWKLTGGRVNWKVLGSKLLRVSRLDKLIRRTRLFVSWCRSLFRR